MGLKDCCISKIPYSIFEDGFQSPCGEMGLKVLLNFGVSHQMKHLAVVFQSPCGEMGLKVIGLELEYDFRSKAGFSPLAGKWA